MRLSRASGCTKVVDKEPEQDQEGVLGRRGPGTALMPEETVAAAVICRLGYPTTSAEVTPSGCC